MKASVKESRSTQATGDRESLDPRALRADFPILHQAMPGGRRLVYLDNAATTQKPRAVIDAITVYYETANANVHRALHTLGEKATLAYEGAREGVAAFINAPEARSLVFTRGTTEAINLAAFGWGRPAIGRGDRIVVTEMEHHSNLVPWQRLAAEQGAELLVVPVRPDGTLDEGAFARFLEMGVKLVAMTHVSNILGTVNPVAEWTDAAQAAGARVLIDGAQSVPHMAVDIARIGCDFYAFSAHKMCGPTGIGALYVAESVVDEMEPFMTGGEMIRKVTLESATWADMPQRFEAGTPPIAEAVGWHAAVTYLQELGMDRIREHETGLAAHALAALRGVEGLHVYGDAPERAGVISFRIDGLHPHDVAQWVDREGVALRAGHGCAQPLLQALGTHAVSRVSFYLYNDRDDVDALVAALEKARRFFDHGTR